MYTIKLLIRPVTCSLVIPFVDTVDSIEIDLRSFPISHSDSTSQFLQFFVSMYPPKISSSDHFPWKYGSPKGYIYGRW